VSEATRCHEALVVSRAELVAGIFCEKPQVKKIARNLFDEEAGYRMLFADRCLNDLANQR
jgi:hypothetical protein